jgi:hypothetical protein
MMMIWMICLREFEWRESVGGDSATRYEYEDRFECLCVKFVWMEVLLGMKKSGLHSGIRVALFWHQLRRCWHDMSSHLMRCERCASSTVHQHQL